jgi:polyphosphate kinase 2
MLNEEFFDNHHTREQLIDYLIKNADQPLFKSALENFTYETELRQLQAEMVSLQKWVQTNGEKIAVLFEGRDASGKGGTIRRFSEHLNPRAMRVVALNKPTEVERSQWYFNRYIKQLPNAGEIVFFDRSWYNRAVVEPVMGFCTESEYQTFMTQVPEFEHMLYESGVKIIKFWFSISKNTQMARFERRLQNPLKKWKFSPVDQKAQEKWADFSYHKKQMFSRSHHAFSPWIVVEADNKKAARIESMKYLLSQFNYEGKGTYHQSLFADPNVVHRFFRMSNPLDQ